jgi:hypothetical protein
MKPMDERTNALALSLRECMEREADLFAALGLEVERLRESFAERQWSPCLEIGQAMERSARMIECADGERDAAFEQLRDSLGVPAAITFSALLPGLPPQAREELEQSWRKLRMAVVRLKTGTGRLRYSAEALSSAFTRVLEGIFPYRKGKIYSRRGTPTSVSGALLVDRKQ